MYLKGMDCDDVDIDTTISGLHVTVDEDQDMVQ
jgi:hypothetical protein